jgi:hypothetical protein
MSFRLEKARAQEAKPPSPNESSDAIMAASDLPTTTSPE